MNTFAIIIMLILFGVVANFLSIFVLNIVGIPGALIAGTSQNNKIRYTIGSIVCIIGQSLVYVIYIVFIVSRTALAIKNGVSIIIWPVAFLVVIPPLASILRQAQREAKETDNMNVQVEALNFTFFISFISFFIFAFSPNLVQEVIKILPFLGYK